jgi:capsular polysaccharide biosynthesis protein
MMNDNDQAVMLSPGNSNGLPGRFWVDDFTAADDVPPDFSASLVSLGFIKAAIRRSGRLLIAMALGGFLIGSAAYLASPHAAQATTTLILTVGPEAVPGTAIQDDVAIAQSRAVAGLAVHKLGLAQSADGFLGSYTATPVTDRVLLITVNAPSNNEAVTWADTLATEFLHYRAEQLNAQQQQMFAALNQQVNQAKAQVNAVHAQIRRVSAQPRSPAQQGTLTKLRAQATQQDAALIALVQSVNSTRASTQETTASEVNGSGVLDTAAAVPPHSKLKHLVLYAAIGLFAGLILGLAFVVIRAIVSDRLFRRDDVARALGAPVRLSVGTVKLSRWRPGRRGLAAVRRPEIQRIAQHLGRAVMPGSRGIATLAVVPVDDPQVAALSLTSLALSCAQEGLKVIVADLCRGNPAARLLDVDEPGVHTVNVDDAHLIVTVPDRDDIAPAGPLAAGPRRGQPEPSAAPLAAACASANLLLTLVSLDPSVPADHLNRWADGAVAIVTAGRSSWTKIHAAGEMIRLAGTHLVSGVLVGADKHDDSLGVIPTPSGTGREMAAAETNSRAEREGFFAGADRGTAGGRSSER